MNVLGAFSGFSVDNITAAVDELVAKGVVFEHYGDMGNGATQDA